MTELELILALLVVVAALATVARRIGIPAPILMVVGGIAIGFLPGLPTVDLDPNVVFLIFLPPLLYVAAVFAPLRDYRANARAIGLLAVGLVLVTAGAVAVVVRALVPTLGWAEAFALGAIVAPPDAVAATSILQRIGVPRRIVAILEGESLLNDATALVAYRLALASAASGVFVPTAALTSFILVATGGVAVGLAIGALAVALRQRLSDTPVSITISILTPFTAYLAAEQLGASGVLATVTAGLYVGRRLAALSSEERVAGGAVWQTMSFILNGLLFTLVGLQLPSIVRGLGGVAITDALALGLLVALTAIVVRFIWVFPASYLPRLLPRRAGRDPAPSWRGVTVVSWAGMRGAVSLAAALALPVQLGPGRPFAERDLFVFVTFCVIVVTLVGQGLSLPLVARALGVVATQDGSHEEMHARAAVAEAALALLPDMRTRWPGHAELVDRLQAEYEHRMLHAEEHGDAEIGEADRETLEHRQMRQELIDAERAAAREMHGRAAISDEVYRRLVRDLDLDELRSS
jgi:CPA1 family monovalent cation:H+ antiporter